MQDALFSEELSDLKIREGFETIIQRIILISLICCLAAYFLLDSEPFLRLSISISILILPSCFAYFFLDYFRDKKQKSIDLELPEVLFQIASFPKSTPLERIIELIANKKSVLGSEFRKVDNLIKAGFDTSDSLREISAQNSSILLKRAISLILETLRNGGSRDRALFEISQDIFQMQSLRREQASALAMQKYTLILGSAILLPLISALLLGVVGSLSFESSDSLIQLGSSKSLAISISNALQIYIFILSALSAVFIAMQEGKVKKAPLYFCYIYPIGALVFNIVKSASLI